MLLKVIATSIAAVAATIFCKKVLGGEDASIAVNKVTASPEVKVVVVVSIATLAVVYRGVSDNATKVLTNETFLLAAMLTFGLWCVTKVALSCVDRSMS